MLTDEIRMSKDRRLAYSLWVLKTGSKLALVTLSGLRILRHARLVDPLGARGSAADVRIDFCW